MHAFLAQAALTAECPELKGTAAEALDSVCAVLDAQMDRWASLLSMEGDWARMVAASVQGALPLPSALTVRTIVVATIDAYAVLST